MTPIELGSHVAVKSGEQGVVIRHAVRADYPDERMYLIALESDLWGEVQKWFHRSDVYLILDKLN